MSKKPFEDFLKYVKEDSKSITIEDVERAEEQTESIKKKFDEAELNRYLQDTSSRNKLTTWAATLVSFWLIAVLIILAGNTAVYKLDNSVLMTLLGTTTFNILGLMVIVLNDLFNKANKN